MDKEIKIGEKVFCFNFVNPQVITDGFIKSIEISDSGFLQYRVETPLGIFIVNDKSVDKTKEGIEEKFKAFNDFKKKTEDMSDEYFGKPHFNMEELKKDFPQPDKK